MGKRRLCEWCRGPLGQFARSDKKCCSKKCRQAKYRFRVGGVSHSSETRRMSFGYADPPYPGLAKRYYGSGAQEVNHRVLIGTMERDYPDGWALSTSASALASVLMFCPPEARVCAWVKSVRYRFHHSWEPLIVVGGRTRRVSTSLVWGGRQHSHPMALVGMKPAAFCEWMFRLLGAERDDEMSDIFPGSGSVSRAWDLYTSQEYSLTPSRLDEAKDRVLDGTNATHTEMIDLEEI